MKGKVAIVGHGSDDVISAYVAKKLAADLVQVETLTDPFNSYPVHVIHNYTQMPVQEERSKPTCKKHHEYEYKETKEISQNIYHEIWRCRHCNKQL